MLCDGVIVWFVEFEWCFFLICVFCLLVGYDVVLVDDKVEMVNDNFLLGKVGLYKVIKFFIVGVVKFYVCDCEWCLVDIENKFKVAEFKYDVFVVEELFECCKYVFRELVVWICRSVMSIYWMRYIFVVGILRDNFNDVGLKMV